MLLHNQTKNHLRWKISLTEYTCEPWGSVEVPDMFVLSCKKRGLPLDVAPVPAEVRAQKMLGDATEAARSDELIALQREIEGAKASEVSAKKALENEKVARAAAEERALKLETALAEQKRLNEELTQERAAAEALLNENAKKLEAADQKAKRLEATLDEQQRARKASK